MKKRKGSIKTIRHESGILKGNPLGDPHKRDLIVYLPPNYGEDRERSYPTLYCLTGFTGRGSMFLNDSAFSKNLPERLDSLIATGRITPLIAVMPDCFTRYGGSQYINSAATGDYEDYLTAETVAAVDERFRTIRRPEARAVAGKSSGGYGSLIMAMRHSDVFRSAATISGDCYFEMCYKPDFKKAFRAIGGDPLRLVEKFWDEAEPKKSEDFDGLNAIAMAACYSPNPGSECGFDLPFDPNTGEILEDVWNRWLAHDPVHLVESSLDNLREMALIFIDAGTRDEFALDIGARVLSRRLKESGISHMTDEFDDGHFNINYRYDRAFEVISKSFEKLGVAG